MGEHGAHGRDGGRDGAGEAIAHDAERVPVDPVEIRYRPGVRREGAFSVQYVTIHGYRRAYVKAGLGPGAPPHPRHRGQLRHAGGPSSSNWPSTTR